MTIAIGVDGCKGGWICCLLDTETRQIGVRLEFEFPNIVLRTPVGSIIAVDVPIGLSDDHTGRTCDSLARSIVGPRRNSVFTPPRRQTINCESYTQACRVNRGACGDAISKQAFNIMGKIREVDSFIDCDLQSRIFEAHPEVSFWALNGGIPMSFYKRDPRGIAERWRILESAFGIVPIHNFPRAKVQVDDLHDALACAWTASRISSGCARHLTDSSRDSRGLRKAITY